MFRIFWNERKKWQKEVIRNYKSIYVILGVWHVHIHIVCSCNTVCTEHKVHYLRIYDVQWVVKSLTMLHLYNSNQQSAIKWLEVTQHTGCPRRNVRDFGRVFLMLNYTDITQNTYVRSRTVTEIMAREKCGHHRCRHSVGRPWRHTCPMRLPDQC